MVIIVSLIILGLLLLLTELLLVPGVGVAGILGLASFGASCWYAWVKIDAHTGMVVTLISIFLILGFLFYALRAKTWRKLALDTEIDTKVGEDSKKVEVGDCGKTLSRLAPQGTAVIKGIRCEVKSETSDMVDPGTEITVSEITDNIIIVKPITE